MTIAECASETTCSAKESPCDKSRATAGVSCHADALPAHSRLLIFRPTRCTERSLSSTVRLIIRLEVMTVISLMRAACSADNCNVRSGSVVSVVEKRKTSLLSVNRQYELCDPRKLYNVVDSLTVFMMHILRLTAESAVK